MDSNPSQQSPSQVFSIIMICPPSCWSLGVNNCLINQFMPEVNNVKTCVLILCTKMAKCFKVYFKLRPQLKTFLLLLCHGEHVIKFV